MKDGMYGKKDGHHKDGMFKEKGMKMHKEEKMPKMDGHKKMEGRFGRSVCGKVV
jgi:hypothetical protein